MQTGYLDTIIKIELVIVLAHRNSGPYRRCTWFVNLGSRHQGKVWRAAAQNKTNSHLCYFTICLRAGRAPRESIGKD